jgi:lipopolysaccharide cholinephosphotransferase
MHTLTNIQERELYILKSLTAFLDTRGLRYYIISGTLLGAVRHGGFIPWDDDIDIAMPREDYNKLVALPDSVFPPPFKLHEITRMPDYYELYAKFVDTSTSISLLERQRRAGNDKHLWVDIFPLDGLPDNPLLVKLILLQCAFLKWFYILSISDSAYRRNRIKNLIIKAASLFSYRKIYAWFYKVIACYPFYESNKIIFAAKFRTYRIYPREICGTPVKIPFEDDFFYAPEKPGEYLAINYGKDYMRMPEKHERRTHQYVVIETD